MKKYNHGKIVTTTSFAGRRDLPHGLGFGHYGMTKAAVNYITQSAAFAGADYNINVNAVGPGIVLTKMWEDILDTAEKEGKNRKEVWNEYIKTYIPLARGAQTHEDIGYMMVFLCSKYADHITDRLFMWMGEQQQLKKLDKKRNFSIILEKAKKFFTSLPFCFFGGKKVLLV